MKVLQLILFLLATCHFSLAQTMREMRDSNDLAKLYLATDVKAITSSNNSSQVPNTSTGKLGFSFQSKFFYGSVLFNVINRNSELTSTDTAETKIFANNLLIPDNSGEGISNFRIALGFQSFSKYGENWDDVPLLSWKRVGFYGFWQANNTLWTKDSISLPTFISTVGFFATYNIISFELFGDDKEKVHLSYYIGFENRILGGDYSLAKNQESRVHFLGTDKLKFRSFPTVGFKIEVAKFYGEFKETYFGEDNIDGFSGWQATISVGINVDLNIASKRSDPTK